MLTVALPPNTAFRLSSALIMRLFFLSCMPFFLMYAHSFLVTSVRGIAFDPTTSASLSLGCTGILNAAFGLRFAAAFFAISSHCERRRAERDGGYRERHPWIVTGRRLPLDGLRDQLKVERALEDLGHEADGPHELVDRPVHVLAVARVEQHLLCVALDVADAQVI